MARAAVEIGGVVKLTINNIHDQKLRLRDPKSGRGYEYGYIPVKVAERLRKKKAKPVCQSPDDRKFSDFNQS